MSVAAACDSGLGTWGRHELLGSRQRRPVIQAGQRHGRLLPQASGTTLTLGDICAAEDGEPSDEADGPFAWAVGLGGLILHWDGSSWKQQASGVTTALQAVACLDDQHAYAVGNNVLVSTKDGGATWTAETVAGAGLLTDVVCVAADRIFVTDASQGVWRRSVATDGSVETVTWTECGGAGSRRSPASGTSPCGGDPPARSSGPTAPTRHGRRRGRSRPRAVGASTNTGRSTTPGTLRQRGGIARVLSHPRRPGDATRDRAVLKDPVRSDRGAPRAAPLSPWCSWRSATRARQVRGRRGEAPKGAATDGSAGPDPAAGVSARPHHHRQTGARGRDAARVAPCPTLGSTPPNLDPERARGRGPWAWSPCAGRTTRSW